MIEVSQAKGGIRKILGQANGICKDCKSGGDGVLEGRVIGKKLVWLDIRDQMKTGIK